MPSKKPFGKDWKFSPFKSRCVKFFGDNSYEAFVVEFQERYRLGVNLLSLKIHRSLTEGTYSIERLLKNTSAVPTEIWTAYNKELEAVTGIYQPRLKRSMASQAIRFYKGYFKRNKKIPPKAPTIRANKSINLQDGIVTDLKKEKKLSIVTFGGDPSTKKYRTVELPYTLRKDGQSKHSFISSNIGGNLVLNSKPRNKSRIIFVARATIPFDWLYDPIMAIGTDFNLGGHEFVSLSQQIPWIGPRQSRDATPLMLSRIPRTQRMEASRKRLVELNKKLKTVNSRQRRGIRRKIQRTHRHLMKQCVYYCERLVAWAIENKALLCIDKLSCGAKTGSFGQDKMVALLVKMCENQRVPFVLVPTPFTSKLCNCCQEIGVRKNAAKLECQNCGTVDAQLNAAKNIADFGWKIWKDGLTEFNAWVKTLSGQAADVK